MALLLVSVSDQIQKGSMDAGIFGKFGMKRRCHGFSLPYGYGIVAFGRDDFDSRTDALNPGGADKHHLNR